MTYQDVYAAWQNDPEAFWMQAASGIDWIRPPSKALFGDRAPLYEWFSDGIVNACWNAVDRHVEAGGRVLGGHVPPEVSARVAAWLAEAGVRVRTDHPVPRPDRGALRVEAFG